MAQAKTNHFETLFMAKNSQAKDFWKQLCMETPHYGFSIQVKEENDLLLP